MSTVRAYDRMSGRVADIETEPKDEHAKLIAEEELKTWLTMEKTQNLLIYLARRELELLNAARNSSRLNSDNSTNRFLHISIGIREVIEYITENKQSTLGI